MARDDATAQGVALGGYLLRRERAPLGLVFAATGSEVALAMAAAETLEAGGIGARVVSLPCVERFLAQPRAYRDALLPRAVPALGVEAGHPAGLLAAMGPGGRVHGIATFGESGPGPALMEHFGFTVEAVVARARAVIDGGE
jgi:transketolase